MRSSVRQRVRELALALALALAPPAGAAEGGSAAIRHHFAANGNFDETGRFAPAAAGFDIADVASAAQLETLPPAVKGLMWIGLCDGVDAKFVERAGSALGSRKLFGFYLMDDPDPSGRWREACSPDALRAEADWIHLHRADALVFVGLMNIGDAKSPAFDQSLRPERTHIDLFGVAPYPCRSEWPDCDDAMIGRFVAAARRAGIPDKAIVPIYQTFGGGNWRTDSGGRYRMPRPDELKRMFRSWTELTPAPVFDFAYSWGPQRSDDALGGSPALQSVFGEHNRTK
jgi:hypothetical protein